MTIAAQDENRSEQMNQRTRALIEGGFAMVIGSANEYSQEEMQEAFSAVQSQSNWKLPVDAKVPVLKLCVTSAAVAHFTGSECYIKQIDAETCRVYAPGYYETIGS